MIVSPPIVQLGCDGASAASSNTSGSRRNSEGPSGGGNDEHSASLQLWLHGKNLSGMTGHSSEFGATGGTHDDCRLLARCGPSLCPVQVQWLEARDDDMWAAKVRP